ncbi:unnamed protein product [Miscanthus lutarioriparius]|uniref:NB-ARC domain-containing protein n=1 Tax=Miscanthus lutarioriparius TaxID=422564 RepID=A0A811QH73_9POAL|nr:unnamed protein product [Miscanthus lutarioriparius]
MAAVLDAFAPYVKKLITDMAQAEMSMMLGVSGEITKLEDNMEGLKASLAMPRGDALPTQACKDGQQSSRTPCDEEMGDSIFVEDDDDVDWDDPKPSQPAAPIEPASTTSAHGPEPSTSTLWGGMSKTTLAQKIFNDATIQEHFKKKIWLSITQQFDVVELLRTAIENAGGGHGGRPNKNTLIETLINTLSTGRFLLVMDDVWSHEAWNHVLSVPKQLQPDQVVGIDPLKTIGMEILENCDGLPLAIKMIGGLLSTRYPSEHEWKSVLNKPAWSLTGLPPELDNRIYLSYEDLSPQLKQCFLYCSLFPKGEELVHGVETQMWIGEGFIQPPGGSTNSLHEYGFEEIAIEYYQELIKRNFIEPIEEYSLTGYSILKPCASTISCPSRIKWTGAAEAEQQQQGVIEEVWEKLCPPTCLENLRVIGGYLGRLLPNWMCAPASVAFKILRCFKVYLHSTYAIDCPMLKRINNLSWLQKIRIIGCPNEQVLKGVPSLDWMR